MKKVLIITHYFPPRVGIGSVRLGGLVKYLPKFGWHPIVLTSKLPCKPEGNFTLVETPAFEDTFTKWKRRLGADARRGFKEQMGALANIESRKSKIESRIISLGKGLLAYPDPARNWYAAACEYASKAIRENHISALLSSSSPVTAHLIASTIKRKHRLPWVADLRDLWTQNHYYPYGILRKTIERQLELRTLQEADALVTVSEPLADTLRLLHKQDHILSITNGFDPDDYTALPLTKKFTITYTGQLYEGKRDPRILLTAIRELLDNKRIDESRVRIRFFGPKASWLENFIKDKNLEAVVSFELVDRFTALRKQAESQVLLILNWDDPNEKGVYTGKLFEYLGAKRPIIATSASSSGDNVVKQLLEVTHSGYFVSSPAAIKSIILDYYKDYETTGSVMYKGKWDQIKSYTHYEMAKKFSDLFDTVTR